MNSSPKNEHLLKSYSPSGQPRYRSVCFFSISPINPLQWMGAVRMRVQTTDKIFRSNPHDSSLSINILWNEKLHVCTNKSIITRFLTSNCCFWVKYDSLINNIVLNQERNIYRSSTVYKPKQTKTALNKYVCGFWCERQQVYRRWTFSLEEELLRIMDLYFSLKQH